MKDLKGNGHNGGRHLATYRMLIFVMAVAIGLNVVQFSRIESETRHNYRAFHSYETGNIFEIAIASDASARRRVAPFYYLGILFPGSTIVIPTEGISTWFPFEESVLAFGMSSQIRTVEYDPTTVDLADLDRYRLNPSSFVSDKGRAVRMVGERVSFYVGSDSPSQFLIATPDGAPGRSKPFAFIDIDLVDEQVVRDLEFRG